MTNNQEYSKIPNDKLIALYQSAMNVVNLRGMKEEIENGTSHTGLNINNIENGLNREYLKLNDIMEVIHQVV